MTAVDAEQRVRGFTLVEMLIAITILSMVMVMAFSSMRIAAAVASRVDAATAESRRVHQAQRLLRGQLQRAMPVLDARNAEQETLDFGASQHEISFVAPMSVAASMPGLYRVSLKVTPASGVAAGTNRLLLSYRLWTPGRTPGPADTDVVELMLIEGFRRSRFSFYDGADNRSPRWVDEWRTRQTLPSLVRIEIEGGAFADHRWPAMIVPLRLAPPRVLAES